VAIQGPTDRIEILIDRCVGCGLCIKACPFGAIRLEDGKAVIDYDCCTVCGACVSACRKFRAIRGGPEATTGTTPPSPGSAGEFWVFAETGGAALGGLRGVAAELLAAARRLAAGRQKEVIAVLIGHGLAEACTAAIALGADRVLCADDPSLERYDDEAYAAILADLIERHRPEVLLGGATAVGRSLLPRVAVMVHTGLTADCTELEIDPDSGLLLQTRPAFGGNILATITCRDHRPQMATVRPGVLPRRKPDPLRTGKIDHCAIPPRPKFPKFWREFHPRASGGAGLRGAEIIEGVHGGLWSVLCRCLPGHCSGGGRWLFYLSRSRPARCL